MTQCRQLPPAAAAGGQRGAPPGRAPCLPSSSGISAGGKRVPSWRGPSQRRSRVAPGTALPHPPRLEQEGRGVRVFISHCGNGSVSKALQGGRAVYACAHLCVHVCCVYVYAHACHVCVYVGHAHTCASIYIQGKEGMRAPGASGTRLVLRARPWVGLRAALRSVCRFASSSALGLPPDTPVITWGWAPGKSHGLLASAPRSHRAVGWGRVGSAGHAPLLPLAWRCLAGVLSSLHPDTSWRWPVGSHSPTPSL